MKLTKDIIEQAVNAKEYKWFSNGMYNVNIIGIRNKNTSNVTNSFDDVLTLSYKDETGQWQFKTYEITTDPGRHWMNHPLNKDGTAILVPGQYRGVYAVDKHRGKYYALCQRKDKVKVYRDNDRDNEYDFDSDTIQEGMFGINIHRSNPYDESYYVDKWSAGCQVFKKVDDFNEFMDIINKSRTTWGNSFTYTLLESSDLKND